MDDDERRRDDDERRRDDDERRRDDDEKRELELLPHWFDYARSGDDLKTREGYSRWLDDQAWLGRRRAQLEEQDHAAQSERDRLLRERRSQWEDMRRDRGEH